ncbi:MAG: hypothetical protein R3F61_18265 [Myxococcota bacterium]
MDRGVRALWLGDRRSPCGEAWLLEHAPRREAPNSPLGRARNALRALIAGDPLDPAQSLDLRPEGLPSEAAREHLELLVDRDLPDGFADPWLAAWHGIHQDDPQSAARLVAWSAWDPDDERRARLLEEVAVRFDMEPACGEPACLWSLADRLSGEEGPPGRRDALSDPIWIDDVSPRLAGVAGDWVGEWRTWVAGDRGRRGVVRMGVGKEPAAALWVGGTYRGRTLLDAELGFVAASEVADMLPREVPSDTAGGRAAALIPW